MEYLVFVSDGMLPAGAGLNARYWVRVWQPSITRVIPPGLDLKYSLWWAFHHARVFRNRDYAVLLIGEGDIVVHRSCIVPAYYRWPFMKDNDCQISNTWTHPDYRGRGLATIGLMRAVAACQRPGRSFWYVSREANLSSVSVCTRAGFTLVGHARRTRRMGSSVLGQLIMDPIHPPV